MDTKASDIDMQAAYFLAQTCYALNATMRKTRETNQVESGCIWLSATNNGIEKWKPLRASHFSTPPTAAISTHR